MIDWAAVDGSHEPLGALLNLLFREPGMGCLGDVRDHSKKATLRKAWALRKWTVGLCNYCAREYLIPGFSLMKLLDQLRALRNYEGGVWCGDTAALFVNMLRLCYIPAARFSYGYSAIGLSHVTVLIGYLAPGTGGKSKSFEFTIFDPYLGFHYEDTATQQALPMPELLRRVIQKEYETVQQVDTELVRPYIANPNEQYGFRGWLFPGGQQPRQGVRHGKVMVYQGASNTVDKLFSPGSPMWNLAAEKRGDKLLGHYLLDLMLVEPHFNRVIPELHELKWSDAYPEYEFFHKLTKALMEVCREH